MRPGLLVSDRHSLSLVSVLNIPALTELPLDYRSRLPVASLWIRKFIATDRFFAASGVQLAQSTSVQFHYRRPTFSSHLKSNILVKAAALWITLNIDGVPIDTKSHTHPSHS
jgi:hypothetical protein